MADLRTNYSTTSPGGDLLHTHVNEAFGKVNGLVNVTAPLAASAVQLLTGTVSTAAATAAKTVTLNAPNDAYVPVVGDRLELTFTNGNTASVPTLSVNGGAVRGVVSGTGGTNASSTSIAAGITMILVLRADGSWQYIGSSLQPYSAITTAEIDLGTSAGNRVITPQMAAYIRGPLLTARTVNGTETCTIASGSITQVNGTTIGGVTMAVGDKFVVLGAPAASGAMGAGTTSQPANGLYQVTVVGANLTVTRAAEMSSTNSPIGKMIRITEGSNYGPAVNTIVTVTSPTSGAFTYGTTAMTVGDYFLGYLQTLARITTLVGSGRSARTASVTSAATYTINVDNVDSWRSTAQAANVTAITISGTPFNGHVLTMEWADNGTARTIARGSSFVAGVAPMVATTIVGSTIRETFRYNALISKYECIDSTIESVARPKFVSYTNASTSVTYDSGALPTPPGAVGVEVMIIPPGSGGGSGRRGAAGTARGGGGGGAAQPVIRQRLACTGGTDTYRVLVGVVGAGGAAVTTDNTDGNIAASVGGSTFQISGVTMFQSSGTSLAGGTGGSTVGGTGGNATLKSAASSQMVFVMGGDSGLSAIAGDGVDAWSPQNASGGGAGGGISAANVAYGGGNGGRARYMNLGTSLSAGGLVDSTAPAAPAALNSAHVPGQGGGGGAASITTAAQAGANGVGYGAPGGGGGASLNGFNSGKGGDGGPGLVRLEWIYA